MKQIPLHIVVSQLRAMSLPQQVRHLREMVQAERPYSVYRNHLESLLRGKVAKQIRHETTNSKRNAVQNKE